eukprot:21367-Heterococcus_DN1.PRE.2
MAQRIIKVLVSTCISQQGSAIKRVTLQDKELVRHLPVMLDGWCLSVLLLLLLLYAALTRTLTATSTDGTYCGKYAKYNRLSIESCSINA